MLGEPPEESRQDYLNQILKVSRAKNKELRLKKQQAEAAAAKPKGEPTEVEVEPNLLTSTQHDTVQSLTQESGFAAVGAGKGKPVKHLPRPTTDNTKKKKRFVPKKRTERSKN